jgi:hypothetical protein
MSGLPRVITGRPGPEVDVVCQPIGRPATVLTATGAIIDGWVVPDGYVLADSEVPHRGPEVRARLVNKDGTVVVNADREWQKGASPGGGWMFRHVEEGARWEIAYVSAVPALAVEAA